MTINPDDLLIFKKRKSNNSDNIIRNGTQESQEETIKKVENKIIKQPITTTVIQKETPVQKESIFKKTDKQTATPIPKTSPINTTSPIIRTITPTIKQPQPTSTSQQIQQKNKKLFFKNKKHIDDHINKQINKEAMSFDPFKEKNKKELFDSLFTEEEAISTINYDQEKPLEETKNNKTSVSGLYCIYHPWRKAYAICEYCHRSFCFADLSKNNGKYYCIEDLDHIQRIHAKTNKHYIYNYLAGIIFFVSAGIILYYSYPQVHYSFFNLINTVKAIGILNFIKSINFAYIYSLQNSLIVLFSIIGGLLLFIKSNKTLIASVLILVSMMLVVSYNYLNSNVSYLLYVFIACLLSLSLIALEKMSDMGDISMQTASDTTEWPKFETF